MSPSESMKVIYVSAELKDSAYCSSARQRWPHQPWAWLTTELFHQIQPNPRVERVVEGSCPSFRFLF